MPARILTGTASWADPGFIADWYPKKLPASERLSYYADHFKLVELNSSFYGVPNPVLAARWVKQTPDDFKFDVKLHKLLSRHSAKLDTLPPALRGKAKVEKDRVVLDSTIERALAKAFREAIKPIEQHNKLGALLLQLSPSFSPKKHKLNELDHLFEQFPDAKLAVELRNKHWVEEEQLQKTLDFFRERKIAFVAVDAPETSHFMAMPKADFITTPELGYMRLHGRNATGYVTGKTVAERFNYLYTDKELEEIAQRTASLANQADEMHVVYNNNASDYAIQSASRFKELIRQKFPQLHSE